MYQKFILLCANISLFALMSLGVTTVHADEPFLGEVRWFAGNFAPRGWAFCDGTQLQIAGHEALFSLLGTTYGGDGRTVFNLPDLRGRGMVHAGNGPGLANRPLGEKAGVESVALNVNELPSHNHTLNVNRTRGDSVLPNDRVIAKIGRTNMFAPGGTANTDMGETSIISAGGGVAHNNMQPSIALNCIIALQGVFPSRN